MSIHKQLVKDLERKQALKVISGCTILFFVAQRMIIARFFNILS